MNIKVQIVGGASVPSAIRSGLDKMTEPLTFIAFSDTMKARILEKFLKSPEKIGLSIYDGPPAIGEWHEPLIETAIFNRK